MKPSLIVLVLVAGCQTPRPTNTTPPPRDSAASAAPASQPTYETLVARGSEDLRLKTALQEQTFQIGRAQWNVDQNAGVIRFESPTGTIATALVQIIGVYRPDDRTWTWAWANPAVNTNLAQHAAQLRAYGEAHGLSELTAQKLVCDEQHCWTFVAADVAMNKADGAYCGHSGNVDIFMTFGTVNVSNQPEAMQR